MARHLHRGCSVTGHVRTPRLWGRLTPAQCGGLRPSSPAPAAWVLASRCPWGLSPALAAAGEPEATAARPAPPPCSRGSQPAAGARSPRAGSCSTERWSRSRRLRTRGLYQLLAKALGPSLLRHSWVLSPRPVCLLCVSPGWLTPGRGRKSHWLFRRAYLEPPAPCQGSDLGPSGVGPGPGPGAAR